MNANIKNNQMTKNILKQYLDYKEDHECLRLADPEATLKKVKREVMKLTPENYKI